MLSTTSGQITRGKMRARKAMPYLTNIWSMMRTIETDEVPTMAVDQYARLYVNPSYVETLTPDTVGYVLLHETLHVVLGHAKRLIELCPMAGERERYAWNVAADLVVQQLLARHNMSNEPPDIVRIDGILDPETTGGKRIVIRSIPGLRDGMTAEQYYSLILPFIIQPPSEQGKHACSPASSGSNADGEPRGYEKEPGDADSMMVRSAVRKAGKEIEASGALPGSVAGNIAATISACHEKQPDPFDELRRLVSNSVRSPLGQPEYTYAVPCRRQVEGQVRRRGYRKVAPECSIIIDTSGSMQGCEQRAVRTIAQGLRRVQSPRVVCYDHQLQSAKRLSSVSKFEWQGYGGTDMTTAITDEDKTHRPDAIVLVTDGETSWPERPTNAKLIVALVRKSRYYDPPSWATVVDLTKEVRGYVA